MQGMIPRWVILLFILSVLKKKMESLVTHFTFTSFVFEIEHRLSTQHQTIPLFPTIPFALWTARQHGHTHFTFTRRWSCRKE